MAQNSEDIIETIDRDIDDTNEPEFIEHRVSEWYRLAVINNEDIQALMENRRREAPFKKHWSRDPELWVPTGPQCDERIPLPIQGPAHWTDIWTTMDNVGKDCYEPIPPDQPLLDRQMDYLVTIQGMFTNVTFGIKLGEGAFGQVWHVMTTQTTRAVKACKVIRFLEHSLSLAKCVAHMLTEFNVLQGLKHNNITSVDDYIPIPDFGTGFPYSTVLLFMDLCAGNLTDIIRVYSDGRLPAPTCRCWFKQVAKGVRYIHEHLVVHMDISAINILYVFHDPVLTNADLKRRPELVDDMTFKLSDFGLAVKYVGTDTEWAPIEFHEHCTHDVRQLGMTLYKTLLGQLSLVQSPQELLQIRQTQSVIDADVIDLIVRMIGVNERPTIGDVLSHRWLQWI